MFKGPKGAIAMESAKPPSRRLWYTLQSYSQNLSHINEDAAKQGLKTHAVHDREATDLHNRRICLPTLPQRHFRRMHFKEMGHIILT